MSSWIVGAGFKPARARLLLFLSGLFAFLCLGNTDLSAADPLAWTSLSPLFEHGEYQNAETSIHVFRLHLSRYTLSPIAFPGGSTAKGIAKGSGALLTLNANFFTPQREPLGLVVKDGKTLYPLRPISWWGVFSTEKGRAAIVSQRRFKPSPTLENAVQAGPRLIEKHKIVSGLKETVSAKSAICLQSPDTVALVATQSILSVETFAHFLRDTLNCESALNLDGGNSTQLYAKLGHFELNLPSPVKVPVFLGVFERKMQ